MIPLQGEKLLAFDTWTARGDAKDFLGDLPGPLYVLDVDGYLGREPDFDAIRAIAGEGKDIWLDIGARNASDVMDCLILGAEKTFLNTRNLKGFEEIEKANDLSDSIGVALDLDEECRVVMGLLRCDLEPFLSRILDTGIETTIMVHYRFPAERLMRHTPFVKRAYLCGSFKDLNPGIFRGLIKEV